jgi:nucleoside-diphosphate-sugar epimerase
MQTILGAGGTTGIELAKQLLNYTKDIRLVSRNPKKVNESNQLMSADLSNPLKLDETVKGSEVVYVCIAFEYKTAVWKESWPKFMKNLIASCSKHKAKIVFVDNMYMYDKSHLSHMTEETPINPGSEKGKVRAEIYLMLMDAIQKGSVTGLVARSADFYGPGVVQSALTQSVYYNLLKNKKPQWIGKLDVIHSFTYNKDIGKALAILGNTPDAFNQVWHLPTTQEKLTSRQWIELMMKEMKNEKKIQTLSEGMLGFLGLFIPVLKEFKDIYYQYDGDYYFDSSKFNKRFNFTPTSPEAGVKAMVKIK